MKDIVHKTIAFIRLGRMIFLVGGVIFYNIGVAIAGYSGAEFNVISWGWGQLIVTAVQLMVHYSNDYFDIVADRENLTPTRWSGGSRVLVLEVLSPRMALFTAIILLITALLSTILLHVTSYPGPYATPLIMLAIFLSWFYSAPPLQLHSKGIGEPCAALVVAVLTPLIGFYLQTKRLDTFPVFAVLPLFCLQLSMLLRVAVDDITGDAMVGKHTLAVQLGFKTTLKLIVLCLTLSYILPLLLIKLGVLPLEVSALFINIPLGCFVIWYTWLEIKMSAPQNRVITFLTIALLISSALLELLAFQIAS